MATPFLTPSVAGFLDQANANAQPPDYSPAAQRAGLNGAMAALGWPEPDGARPPEVLTLDSGATVHLFRPAAVGTGAGPLVIYVHGGSFFAGGAASHGPLARTLAEATGATVALIDYRLAPESKAPAALDDCVSGIREVTARAHELGIETSRLAILGDSAGGALAAGTALTLRGEIAPRILVLVNPMTTPHGGDASLRDFATGFFAGATDFTAGWEAYGGSKDPGGYYDLLAVDDLDGLPPTIIITNEADPVRDQGERFAERLSRAGVNTLSLRARGLVHASWLFPKALPEAHPLFACIAGSVRVALEG